MASAYSFNADQQEPPMLLFDTQYNHIWIRLFGDLQGGSIGGAYDSEIV